MWDAVFIAVLLAAVLGLAVKFVVGNFSRNPLSWLSGYHVSWGEYVGVVVAMSLVISPALGIVSSSVAVANKLEREEFINTVETDAYFAETFCYEGRRGSSASSGRSNCEQTYVSGRYSYEVSYSCTDSDGEPDTCYRTEWANIYSPYATVELEYVIEYVDVIEKKVRPVTIAYGVLEENPTPFDSGVAIPASLPRGAPAFWSDARFRLDTGDPRANTTMRKYENPIIASENLLLQEYDGDIEKYREAGLLPLHTRNLLTGPLYDFYLADKAAFVGQDGEYVPGNDAEFQESLMRFNAGLGMTLQGDMHVVFIDADLIPHQSERISYMTAYKAYAMSPEMGKRQIAKNTIIVVMGIKDDTVEWATATTGMPHGNEPMIRAIEVRLPGTPLVPEEIFGNPVTKVSFENGSIETELTLSTPRGVLEKIVFEDYKFERVCMDCEDKEEAGQVGYTYLRSEIEPSTTAKVWMVTISSVIALALWWLAAHLPLGKVAQDILTQRRRNRYPHY